jgi:hypothetical protein
MEELQIDDRIIDDLATIDDWAIDDLATTGDWALDDWRPLRVGDRR